MNSPSALHLALVTGASYVLGSAVRHALQQRGFEVWNLSRSAKGPGALPLDLAAPEAASLTLAKALNRLPRHELTSFVFVHNAAVVAPVRPVAANRPLEMAQALQVNLAGPILLIRTALKAMQKVPCRKLLAHITSGAVHRAHAGIAHYAAAKAGLEQFVRVVAAEQALEAHPFVAVNIDPGALDTGMQATLRHAAASLPVVAEMQRRHSLGELGKPDEIATRTVDTLLRPELVNGQLYQVGVRPRSTAPHAS